MSWFSNPFSTRARGPAPADPEAASPHPAAQQDLSISGSILPPTEKFSAHQIFYIFVLDGLGSLLISGGINFAIAYGWSCYVSRVSCVYDADK